MDLRTHADKIHHASNNITTPTFIRVFGVYVLLPMIWTMPTITSAIAAMTKPWKLRTLNHSSFDFSLGFRPVRLFLMSVMPCNE